MGGGGVVAPYPTSKKRSKKVKKSKKSLKKACLHVGIGVDRYTPWLPFPMCK